METVIKNINANKPIITCMIITYNHEKTIRQAIESVLCQKTKHSFIINIEDDCSTDNTQLICHDFKEKYPHIINYSPKKKNIGVVENIYNGIKKINTKYFAILEGDDYWCDDSKLDVQINIMNSDHKISICGHNTEIIDQKLNRSMMFDHKKYNYKKYFELTKNNLTKDFIKIHPSSRVFRTSVIDFNQIKYKESLVWDSNLYWYFLSKGNLFYVNKSMSVYRCNGKGIYSGLSKKKQRIMHILNILIINKELEFKYNKMFMKKLFKKKYISLLPISLIEKLLIIFKIKYSLWNYEKIINKIKLII